MLKYSELIKQVTSEPDNETARMQQLIDVTTFLQQLPAGAAFEIARHLMQIVTDEKLKDIIKRQIQNDYHSSDLETLETYIVPDAIDIIKDIERKLYSDGLISIDGSWNIAHGTRKMFACYCVLLLRYSYFKRVTNIDNKRIELKESDCIKFMKDRHQFKEQASYNIDEAEARQMFPFILDLNSIKK